MYSLLKRNVYDWEPHDTATLNCDMCVERVSSRNMWVSQWSTLFFGLATNETGSSIVSLTYLFCLNNPKKTEWRIFQSNVNCFSTCSPGHFGRSFPTEWMWWLLFVLWLLLLLLLVLLSLLPLFILFRYKCEFVRMYVNMWQKIVPAHTIRLANQNSEPFGFDDDLDRSAYC